MARVNHKLVKQRLDENRSKITDIQFFTSRLLAGHFEDMAMIHAQRYRDDRRVRVKIGWEPESGKTARTNNDEIEINAGHELVTKVDGRRGRYQVVCGFFAHELGHILFTDFLGEQTRNLALKSGRWYPQPPHLTRKTDLVNEAEILGYAQIDSDRAALLAHTSHMIFNVIEDGYIENRIFSSFPGTLGHGLAKLRERHYELIPTVTQLKEMEEAGQSHILESILQTLLSYVKFGEIKYGDEPHSDERIQAVFGLINDLDSALMSKSSKGRFDVVNKVMIRCWPYIKSYCEAMKERLDIARQMCLTTSAEDIVNKSLGSLAGTSEDGTGKSIPVAEGEEPIIIITGAKRKETASEAAAAGSDEDHEESGADSDERAAGPSEDDEADPAEKEIGSPEEGDTNPEEKGAETPEEDDTDPGTKKSVPSDEEEGDDEDDPSDEDDGDDETDSSDEDDGDDEADPSDEDEGDDEADPSGEEEGDDETDPSDEDAGDDETDSSDEDEDGDEESRFDPMSEEGECIPASGNGEVEYNPTYEAKGIDRSGEEIDALLDKMAERETCSELESERLLELNEMARCISYGNVHKGLKVVVNRMREVSDRMIEQYARCAPPLLMISKQLQRNLIRALEDSRRGGKFTGLLLGRKLDARSLHRDDGRVFYKNNLPQEPPQIAVGLLLDESGSMYGEREVYARASAIILYDFCSALGIPIMVYGHSTFDLGRREGLSMYSYAEFDDIDGKDKYRLMDIRARENNRDGAALRYVAERLSKRPEEIKLLIVVSDGQPYAVGYSGSPAEEDMRGIKREYQKKGILFVAAAIGEDKEDIERIYGDAFMDITDLKQLPVKLVSAVKKYIRV